MAVIFKMQCPDCAETFKVPGDQKLPDWCPCCGSFVGSDEDFVPSRMNIGTAKGKSVDLTFRQLEAASIARAEATGNPALKITNMKDNLREGDVAAMPVNNIVTQVADTYKEAVGFNYFNAAVQGDVQTALAGVKTGQERTTGQRALSAIQEANGSVPISTVGGLKSSWGGAR